MFSKISRLAIPFILLTLFVVGCGNSEKESLEQSIRDSLFEDSLAKVDQPNKMATDSANRIDKILHHSCPELKEYIRLNKNILAIIDQVGSDKIISKRYDAIVDSVEMEKGYIMKNKFKQMSTSNTLRFLNLSMLYTDLFTNSLMNQTGLSLSNDNQNNYNDSLVKKIESGE